MTTVCASAKGKNLIHPLIRFIRTFFMIVGCFAVPLMSIASDPWIRQTREQIKILHAGRETAIFHAGAALDKSYIHPLRTPDRHCVTYDAPADHLHHRALCVGWPDISGCDFWAEINSPAGKRGNIIPISVDVIGLPDGSTRIVEVNEWRKEDGTLLLRGIHSWTFLPPQGNLQLLDLDLKLTAAVEDVIFGSDPEKPREYHGLTWRIGPFENPRYFNSDGIEGGQDCQGKPAKWCAMTGWQHGRPVTVAILDSPANDSHPTRFYVQDQGMQFISSSPNFGKPKRLQNGESWHLQYRIVAAGAPPEGKEWEFHSLWNEYARTVK
ncbi:MAG: hypothetical protein C4527_15005 [Candidatus Omnitrophota bacterium]|jgi:hypothetical protein|nr:MAG: hypothetical protein C4527_15005 [Candidatus Omnitrophota bacterium]